MKAWVLIVGSLAAVVVTAAAPDPRALAGRLESPSAAEREEATRALAELGDAARPALEEATLSPDPEVRSRATALLARQRRDDREASRAARRDAARILRTAVLEGLPLVEGGDTDLALASLGAPAADVLADAARRSARRTFVPSDLVLALARHESAASLASLADLWADGSLLPSDAIRAGRILGRRTRTADVGPAVARLRERITRAAAPHRRAGVALAAGIGGAGERDLLLAAAEDGDPGVRAEAARSLGCHLPAAAAETLRTLALDPAEEVRRAALEALLRVPGIPHPEVAVANAGHPRPDVRAAAAALLVREATPETVAVLDAFAADPSAAVRASLRRALSERR